MRTPITKEECVQVIYQQRRKLFFRISNNFPEEEVEKLRKTLAKSGKEQWWAWMYDNRDRIFAFLRNMPEECRLPLDYKNNALLYCAVLCYFRRALDLLELLDTVALTQVDDQNPDEFYRAVAAAAEAIDVLDETKPYSPWPFLGLSPFVL